MTRTIKLPAVENVGPNQKATIRLPLGRTYNKIFLFCEGNIVKTLFTKIIWNLNSGERRKFMSAAHIQSINSYMGLPNDAAVLELNLVEPDGKDEAAMTLGTYALTAGAGVQDSTIEFEIGNYVNSAASKIIAYAEVDVPSNNRLIARTRYQQKNLAGSIDEEVKVPYGKKGEQIKRMYIFGDLTKIDYMSVKREDTNEFQDVSVFQNEYMQKSYKKIPQAGLMVLDFVRNNLQNGMLNTAQILGADGKVTDIETIDIRVKTNAAVVLDIYTESITLNDRA